MEIKFDKKNFLILLIIFIIVLLFTFFDYLVHQLSEEYAVPSRYFRNKIIFGTIIGAIAYFFAKKQKLFLRALIFSAAISVLLQIRYFLEGYPLDFVFGFLAIHFLILTAVSLMVFKLTGKYIKWSR